MSEGWINLTVGLARLVITSVGSTRGVGVCQLNITVELTPRKDAIPGTQLWLGGTIRINNLGALGGYLTTMRTDIHPSMLLEPGGHQTVSLTADIDPRQLQAIENVRTAGVSLELIFSGYSLTKGSVLPYWGINVTHEVDQSAWLVMLEQFGYDPVMLLELEAPRALSNKSANAIKALGYFDEARKNYLQHEWRPTVECLRQCLAALVGKKADDEETADEIADDLKVTANKSRATAVAYDERFELTRRALKYTCDLAAHPESGETTRRDAHASLLAVAGCSVVFNDSCRSNMCSTTLGLWGRPNLKRRSPRCRCASAPHVWRQTGCRAETPAANTPKASPTG